MLLFLSSAVCRPSVMAKLMLCVLAVVLAIASGLHIPGTKSLDHADPTKTIKDLLPTPTPPPIVVEGCKPLNAKVCYILVNSILQFLNYLYFYQICITVESPNIGYFGTVILSFVRRLSL